MSRATREANAEILRQRDALLHAAERVVENARQRNAIDDVGGLPTDYNTSVDMLIVLLEAVQIASPGTIALTKERIRELEAKLAELTAAAVKEKTTAAETVVGVDPATGRRLVQIPGGGVVVGYPRRAGKTSHLHLDPTAQPRKSEKQIRNEVLTKVIEALQLEAYGFHDPAEAQGPFANIFIAKLGAPKPDPEGFWSDIETTLADREEDRELDRVEAARARIEGLTAPAKSGDEPESADFDLAGETLADAA